MSGNKNKRRRRQERQQKKVDTDSSLTPPKSQKSKITAIKSDAIMFQDVISDYMNLDATDDAADNSSDREEAISNALFELANASLVGFRLSSSSSQAAIVVKQDTSACGQHTGGIVWETAFLLLQFLLETTAKTSRTLGRTLEVGAGCGLVGQVLAAQNVASHVVMSETEEVLTNLTENLRRNKDIFEKRDDAIQVHALDWEHVERDAAQPPTIELHSFDTIVGTDVVFSPKLVEPLWKTLQYASHANTNIYLCLQERCATSHALLLKTAPQYQFNMQDITNQLHNIPSCRWSQFLECRLFHITRMKEDS